MDKPKEKPEPKELVRLDETIKLLFELSKPTLVKTLNALFNEKYKPENVVIDMTSTEYPKNNLDMLRADICIKITEYKPQHYHAEIQTEPHKEMAVRMFEYDVMEALRNYRLEKELNQTFDSDQVLQSTTMNSIKIPDEINIFMPKSVVIQIEDGKSVPEDCYALNLTLANGEVVRYTAPVMRYFEYDENRLIKEKLYNLLPLQIFKLRAELDKMTKNKDEPGRQAALLKAWNITDKIAKKVVELYNKKKFTDIDVDKLLIAVSECFQHLNNRYNVNKKLNAEVDTMVRTLMDKTLLDKIEKLKNTKTEIVKKMLLKNKPIDEIMEFTELGEKEIKDIQETL